MPKYLGNYPSYFRKGKRAHQYKLKRNKNRKLTATKSDPGHGLQLPVFVTYILLSVPSVLRLKPAQVPSGFGARRRFGSVKMILMISGIVSAAKSTPGQLWKPAPWSW